VTSHVYCIEDSELVGRGIGRRRREDASW